MTADINDVSLTSLSHLIGNEPIKRSIQVALDFAQTENTAFPSTMLLGGPGLGKSSIAAVIAKEMAADFSEVIGQSLYSISDLNHLLLSASHKVGRPCGRSPFPVCAVADELAIGAGSQDGLRERWRPIPAADQVIGLHGRPFHHGRVQPGRSLSETGCGSFSG